MALIKCTECGNMVSDKASACPNCGCPTKDVLSELARSQETLEAEPKTAEPPAPETPTTPVESAPQSTPSEMIRPATGNDDTEKPCGEKKGHNIVQMLVGLFICFAILCAGFFVFSKKTNKNLQDTHTQTKTSDTYHSSGSSSTSSSSYTKKTDTNTARHSDDDAFYCAQLIVEDYLKAPSTAKFCKLSDATVTHLGNGEYMVTGWVDAENSYGAMIRSDFVVTYTATEKGFKNGNAIIG